MEVIGAPLRDAAIIEPRIFEDERGCFFESWNAEAFANAGMDRRFVQENQSRSAKGVLRGLHFQSPNPQAKLVRVVSGAVYDVIVDIRRSSNTFGRWFGIELSLENRRMLWVPEGFAHGFLSLADGSELIYNCSAPYSPDDEHTLAWDDSELAIDWPLTSMPLLSPKDAVGTPFDRIPKFD